MLGLLEEIQKGDEDTLAAKCAAILIKGLLYELLCNSIVPRKAVLMAPRQLVSSGCGIHSIVCARKFVEKNFQYSSVASSKST